jgi:hypothetical protein
MITTGTINNEGADIVTFCASFEVQLEQEASTFEVHRAFSTPLFNTQTLPTRK